MDPDDAPPRLRWRLLAWLAGALLLLPVLYVAASGPLVWWNRHQYHHSEWIIDYQVTVYRLADQLQMGPLLTQYEDWCAARPALRSMRRQYLVDELANNRAAVESIRKNIAERERDLAASQLRLGALDARTDLTPEQTREANQLRNHFASLQRHLESHARPGLLEWEHAVQLAEDGLREFDRGK